MAIPDSGGGRRPAPRYAGYCVRLAEDGTPRRREGRQGVADSTGSCGSIPPGEHAATDGGRGFALPALQPGGDPGVPQGGRARPGDREEDRGTPEDHLTRVFLDATCW